jgi:RND family efflux transporter MFP subunit
VKKLILLFLVLAGCARGQGDPASRSAQADPSPITGTPVQAGTVAIDTVEVTVSGPGRTATVRETSIRAPFAGTLASLTVADGDPVRAGQQIGSLVSRSSEAGLTGARAMVDSARTPEAKADAERALTLARESVVEVALYSPESGVVTAHAATQGDRVGEGDEIVRLSVSGSIVFLAQIAQRDMGGLAPGQVAEVQLASGETMSGIVHGILPSAPGDSPSVSVRIDFPGSAGPRQIGIQGTAAIRVELRSGVLTVPTAAVLTDDIDGTRRVATVTAQGKVRWVDVETGRTDEGRVEVLSPEMTPGQTVIVSGQVGLPDGSPVQVRP